MPCWRCDNGKGKKSWRPLQIFFVQTTLHTCLCEERKKMEDRQVCAFYSCYCLNLTNYLLTTTAAVVCINLRQNISFLLSLSFSLSLKHLLGLSWFLTTHYFNDFFGFENFEKILTVIFKHFLSFQVNTFEIFKILTWKTQEAASLLRFKINQEESFNI